MTIATLSRIGWIALEADKWEAPSGHNVDLSDTAPHTIRTLIGFDADAWVWKGAAKDHKHLASLTRPPLLSPLRRLLTNTEPDKDWTIKHQAMLRSILEGGLHFASPCLACGQEIVGVSGHHFSGSGVTTEMESYG